MVIDMVVEDNLIKIPQKFKNKRVKIIIIDSEEKEKEKKSSPITRKLNPTLTLSVCFRNLGSGLMGFLGDFFQKAPCSA